jgi:hypothetical protein
MSEEALLQRIRWIVGFFIVGLVLSGVTAFPLLHELEILGRVLRIDPALDASQYTGLQHWIAFVWQALRDEQTRYPFLAYGTDWLAFGHLVIALFFIPAWRDPVRYRAVFQCGLVACAGVFFIASICGPIRGIPIYWRLIDCSFGVFGAIPLLYVLRLTDELDTVRVPVRQV